MDLPRDEMAFRKIYQDLLIRRQLTTVFRPGCRVYPAWRGYRPNEVVTARVIERVGDDSQNIAPIFNQVQLPIRIAAIQVKSVDSLAPEDFAGSSPDVDCVADLQRHLQEIYGQPISAWDNQVTRIEFEFLSGEFAEDHAASQPSQQPAPQP